MRRSPPSPRPPGTAHLPPSARSPFGGAGPGGGPNGQGRRTGLRALANDLPLELLRHNRMLGALAVLALTVSMVVAWPPPHRGAVSPGAADGLRGEAVEAPTRPVPPLPDRPAPAALQARLAALGRGFDGKVGIAVRDIDGGWIAAWDGDTPYPQQSISKLWVAVVVMDAVDRGRAALDEPVVVRPGDLSVFNQPIRHVVTPEGYRTTIDALLKGAITRSDNAANDVLMRRVGGPEAVTRWLAAHGLPGLKIGATERDLQARIAGLGDFQPEWLDPDAFERARDRLPRAARLAARDAYLAAPFDGATPRALVDGLTRLATGGLIGPTTTAHLLEVLHETRTGPRRLKAGLGAGWQMAHKTGTGQDLAGASIGYNDIGIATAPDGHRYAVAVMIAHTGLPQERRRDLMAAVTRAVVDQHDGRLR